MTDTRTEILEWIGQGRLQPDALPTALRLSGLQPGRADWSRFFQNLTLWLSALFFASAVIFFFAYNWQAMGRFAKFGLAEVLIVASLGLCYKLDLNHVAGRCSLLLATLLVGALLALVGQTYQTGADTYELFGVWALAVFPWVAVSRFSVMWLVWLALLNLTAILYYNTFGGWFGFLFNTEQILWVLFMLNTLAWCCWEAAVHCGVEWLRERWAERLLAVVNGSLITSLAIMSVLDSDENSMVALPVYFAWLIVAYCIFRHCYKDVFVLAGGVLSIIVFITVWLSKHLLKHEEAGGYLFIGLLIIGLSALGGFWLKHVANEEQQE